MPAVLACVKAAYVHDVVRQLLVLALAQQLLLAELEDAQDRR
jgi:hypothetical protein